MLPILLFALPLVAQVQVTRNANQIDVRIEGQPATSFFFGPDVSKPYLWPLRTASGIELTRHWPMETDNNDPHDHIHHRGLWFAHSLINGIDFWNSDPSYHTANMGHTVVTHVDTQPEGFTAQIEWRDPAGHALLSETRGFQFGRGEPRTIDVDIVLTAREDVTFGDEKDGIFGIRMTPELKDMTSSEGCHQEAGCWGKRANWVDVSGTFNSGAAGIAVFDDSANPRHPPYWHVRDYGLLANNIFGVKAFTKDPTADGSMKLHRGGTLHFRYRVILHSGDAEKAKISALYQAWTPSK